MNKVINLDDVKNKNRKELEDKANEKYGIIKVSDDLYLYPQAAFTTGSLELLQAFDTLDMTVEELLEENVIEAINEIVESSNQIVNITLIKEKENNMHTFEIVNISNNNGFLLSTHIINNKENIEMFTATIAAAIKKMNVHVVYMLKLSFDDLEEAIYQKLSY